MMRLLLCIGDEPETGGRIESSGTRYTIRGHEVALIGALVHCNACKSSGPITKAGGPRRPWHHGVEVAHENDIVLCKCSKAPRMIASMQSTSRNDDMVESRGDVSEVAYRSGVFDERITLRDQKTGRALPSIRYRIKNDSVIVATGTTDATGRTERITTDAAGRLAVEIAH